MILTIPERIILFNLLPEKGGFSTVKAVHELRIVLGLTEEEREAIGYEEIEGGSRWDSPLDVDIPISIEGFRVSKEVLEALDKKAELTAEHLSLYEKFVEGRALVAVG